MQRKNFNAFDIKIFLTKIEGTGFSDHSNLKILTPKQMLQRLPIIVAQVTAVSTTEHLLNEIRHIIYFLYQAKKITKKYVTT